MTGALKRFACFLFFLTVPLWPVVFILTVFVLLPEWVLLDRAGFCFNRIWGDDSAIPKRRGMAPRVVSWATRKPQTLAERIAALEEDTGMTGEVVLASELDRRVGGQDVQRIVASTDKNYCQRHNFLYDTASCMHCDAYVVIKGARGDLRHNRLCVCFDCTVDGRRGDKKMAL